MAGKSDSTLDCYARDLCDEAALRGFAVHFARRHSIDISSSFLSNADRANLIISKISDYFGGSGDGRFGAVMKMHKALFEGHGAVGAI